MTSPPKQITVECPSCGHRYQDWYRPSINLDLDDFDDDYMREATTATCPDCEHVVELETLVVEGDVWRFTKATPLDKYRTALRDAGFPQGHLEASRRDERLQAQKFQVVDDEKRAHSTLTCPNCGSGDRVAWFWFTSPPETWRLLAGRAGVVAYCDLHERQIAFFMHLMN